MNFVVNAFYKDEVDLYKAGGAPSAVYSAAELVYSQFNDAPTQAVDDLVGVTLATPDAITLEMTALATAHAASSPTTTDAECRTRYAPIVTVMARETQLQPVGEAHAMYDMSVTFEYGETANTDLNGAFSFDGGAWSASTGANHIGNRKAIIRKPYLSSQAFVLLSGFRYRKERLDYTDDGGSGNVCRTDYAIIPEGWVGGYSVGADVSRFDSAGQLDAARGKGWATWFEGEGEYIKATSAGHKYRSGVEAFGVGLYSQSTWSKQVDLHYRFGPEVDHWLYGSNGPIDAAAAIYAW